MYFPLPESNVGPMEGPRKYDITKRALAEFRRILREEHGIEPSAKQAREAAQSLLSLFETIGRHRHHGIVSAALTVDARRYLRNGHDIQALINANIALEVSYQQSGKVELSKWERFRPLFAKKGDNFSGRVIKSLKEKSMSENSRKLIKGAIRERNNIVHGGRREINGQVAA